MAEHIVFLDRSTLQAEVRRPAFEHTWEEYPTTAPAQTVERLREATIAITNKVPLRADTLAQLPKLRMIAVAATGYDVIDLPACRERGIAVANIRNYALHTVPEHAFALILALLVALLATGDKPPEPPANPMSADRVRWEHLQRVYELCDRNVSETARRLNMHRRTLQRILAKRAPR